MKTILALLFPLCLNSIAGEKEKMAVAKSIAEITGVENYKQAYQQAMLKNIQPLFEKYNFDQQTQDKVRAIVRDVSDSTPEADFKKACIESYAQTFSLSELEGILEFFRSPAGRALLEKKNKRTAIEHQALEAIVEKTGREIIERMKKEIPDLQK